MVHGPSGRVIRLPLCRAATIRRRRDSDAAREWNGALIVRSWVVTEASVRCTRRKSRRVSRARYRFGFVCRLNWPISACSLTEVKVAFGAASGLPCRTPNTRMQRPLPAPPDCSGSRLRSKARRFERNRNICDHALQADTSSNTLAGYLRRSRSDSKMGFWLRSAHCAWFCGDHAGGWWAPCARRWQVSCRT